MRTLLIDVVLGVAVLMPNAGTAQVLQRPTPSPQVTAASAAWQLRGDPVFYSGSFYFPAGPSVYFDGNVMVRTGTFEGVPFYVDATLEPYSVVFVPVGGNVVRPYEKRREGQLAGTVGSRMPSFPVQHDSEPTLTTGTTGIITPPANEFEPVVIPELELARPVGTSGSFAPANRVAARAPVPVATSGRFARTRSIETILQPRSNYGVWVPYDGARWVSSGLAVTYSADRFVQVGSYRGFGVYRERDGRPDEIYIPSVAGGPLAPYKKGR